MSSFDWEDFGKEIVDIVEYAIKNQNFKKLNQSITNTVHRAVKYGSEKLKRDKDPFSSKKTAGATEVKLPVKVPSKTGAILSMVFGYPLGIGAFLYCIVSIMAAVFIIRDDRLIGMVCTVASVFFGGLTALGTWLSVRGTKTISKINRLKCYLEAIGRREYCNIAELSANTGRTNAAVLKDIEFMIKKRWFMQGHLDSQKSCLMLTDRMYQQYCQLEKQKALAQEEAQRKEAERKTQQRKEEEKQAESRQELSPDTQKIIMQGEAYVRKIRACNDAIPGEMISAKIERIELLVDKIFDQVEKNPKCVSDIRKLMEYYLPTTVKLLEAYAQMDAQPAGGENIQTAKAEIEATLDTLNVAFEKLLDDLFQETAWDISSDISVLNTMLAQEGLKEDGLKK